MTRKRVSIVAALFVAAFWLVVAPACLFADTWYSGSWQYRQQINVNLGLALSGSLSNFPVLVKITGTNPAGGSAVFSRAKTNGYDILFTASDGVTKLPHEIEKYDSVGQDLEAWVNVPTLSSTGIATIYMYYGNPAAANQQNATAVWDSNEQMVLHLKEPSTAGQNTAIFYDSTANGSNGTQQGTGSVTGQVAAGQSFNGITTAGSGGNLIDIDNVPTDTWTALTVSTWFLLNGANSGPTAGIQRLFSKANGTGTGAAVVALIIDPNAWALHFTTRVVLNTTTAQYDDNPGLANNGNITTGAWHHFAATWSTASNQIIIYLDGSPVPGGALATAGANLEPAASNQNVVLGNDNVAATDRTFNGTMDETRFAHTVRSADWIKASYTNENNATAFEAATEQVFISGTVYADEGVTPIGSGKTVALSIDGGTGAGSLFTTTTDSSGRYGIAVPTTDISSGNRLLAYLQGGPPYGAAVTTSNGGNLSGLDVYVSHVIVRNDNGGSPTVADMTTANNSTADVTALYAKATGFLTNGMTLFVPSGTTFNPGASLNVGSSGTTASARIFGTLNASGTFHVFGPVLGTGTLNGGAATVSVDGGLSVGTYSATTATTTVGGDFAPTSFLNNSGTTSLSGVGVVGTYTFYNLALAGGTRTATGSLTVSNSLTLTSGTFAPGGGTHLIAGNWNDTGVTFTPSGGVVQLTGAAPTITQNVSNYFSGLTIGASTTASLGSAITVQGNLFIQGSLSAGANGITVGGNWTNSGTFTGGSGTVTFTNAALGSTFTGSTTFNNLTCVTPNKTLTFTLGSTQTVTGTLNLQGAAASLINLVSSSTGSPWFFKVTSAGPTAQYVDPSDSNANGNTITATNSIDGGSNVNWSVTPPASTITWTGTIGTDWNTAGNWNPNTAVPGAASNVVIPAGPPNMPTIATGATGSVATLVIQSNASLTLAGTASLAVSGTFTNSGTIYLDTAATAPASPGSGTFVYTGTGGTIPNMGYYNLTVDSVGQTFTLGNALVVNGNLVVNSGTLNATGQSVTASGSVTVNSAGVLTAGTALSVTGSVSGAGTINGQASNVTVGGSFAPATYSASTATTSVGGSWGPGQFMNNNGTVTLTGTGTIAASTFSKLNENGTGSANGNLTVASNLVIAGSLSMGSNNLTVGGALSGAGTLSGGSETVSVTGAFGVSSYTATSASTSAGGAWTVGTFSPGSGTVIFNGVSTLSSTEVFNNLTIASGSSLDTQGNALTINGVFSNGGTLFRRGNDFVSQTDPASGTVQYQTTAGAIQSYPGTSYNNLIVNGNTLTFTPAADLVIARNLTIQAGTTFDVTASSYNLTLGGSWTNNGTFTARNGTVTFNDVTQTSVLAGSTTFYNLSCATPGKILQFTAGVTQNIATGGIFTIVGANGTDVLLRSTAGAYTIALNGTASVTYADVQSSTASPSITALRSVNSGGNTNWVFTGTSYTWNGTTNLWGSASNWIPNTGTPGANDSVIIPSGKSAYPLLTANLTVQDLTIQSGGSLDIASREVTVNGTFINQGSLRRRPMANAISNLTTDSYFNQTDTESAGTVTYYGAGTYIQDYGPQDYANVALDATSPPTITLNYSFTITGSLTIGAGATLAAGGNPISLGGSWANSGTFTAGSNTVYLLDPTQTSVISGNTTFFNLTCVVPGKTVLFASASTQVIAAGGVFTITGAAGSLVTLGRSGGSGTNQWNITRTGTASVSYANVSNSNASATITANTSVNGGNDSNWTFPGAAGNYTWTGALGSTVWNNQGNWNNGVSGFPNATTDTVTIPAGPSFFPALDSSRTMANLTIQSGASMDTAGFTLTVTGTYSNQGTLYRQGGDSVNVTDRVEGTTWYRNVGGAVQDYGAGNDYYSLVLDTGSTYTLTSALATAQNLTINGTLSPGSSSVSVGGALGGTGTFSGGSGALTVAGALSVSTFDASSTTTAVGGGFTPATFAHDSGSVNLNGAGALSAGGVALAFNNLTINAPGATVTLGGPISMAGGITIAAGTLDVGSGLNYGITVSGNWANSGGALTARAGTVTFNSASTSTTISGSTSFFNLTCVAAGKTLAFVAGTTQSVTGTLTLTGASGNLITLQSTTASVWNIAPSTPQSVSFVAVSNSTSAPSSVTASLSADDGGNTNWTFPSKSYTWLGGSSAWGVGTNWSPNGTPGVADSVTIPQVGSGNYPLLAANTAITNVTIQSNASLDTGGFNLTIGGSLSNAGTLFRQGGDTVSLSDTTKGRTVYRNRNGAIQTYGGPDYYRLEIDSNAMTLASNLVVNENLLVVGGSLSPGASQISVAGIWSVASGATFTAGTGTVVLNGTGSQSISAGGTDAAHAFNNLTVGNTAGSVSLGSAIQVNGTLTMQIGTTLDATAGSNFPIGVATNWTNSGTFIPRSGTVTFNGTSSVTPGGSSFNNVSVADGASVTLAANAGVLETLRIGVVAPSTAVFDLAGHNLSGPAAFANNGTLKLQGGETITGSLGAPAQGTILYDGNGGATAYASLAAGNSYTNVQFQTAGTNSWTAAGSLTVTTSLIITSGTLILSNANHTLSGTISGGGALDAHLVAGGNTVAAGGYVGTAGTTLASLSAPARHARRQGRPRRALPYAQQRHHRAQRQRRITDTDPQRADVFQPHDEQLLRHCTPGHHQRRGHHRRQPHPDTGYSGHGGKRIDGGGQHHAHHGADHLHRHRHPQRQRRTDGRLHLLHSEQPHGEQLLRHRAPGQRLRTHHTGWQPHPDAGHPGHGGKRLDGGRKHLAHLGADHLHRHRHPQRRRRTDGGLHLLHT